MKDHSLPAGQSIKFEVCWRGYAAKCIVWDVVGDSSNWLSAVKTRVFVLNSILFAGFAWLLVSLLAADGQKACTYHCSSIATTHAHPATYRYLYVHIQAAKLPHAIDRFTIRHLSTRGKPRIGFSRVPTLFG